MQDAQFRAISALLAYPFMALNVPSYLFSGYELEPVFRALKLEAECEITRAGLWYGLLTKYPHVIDEAIRARFNADSVPCQEWANTQIEHLKKLLDESL